MSNTSRTTLVCIDHFVLVSFEQLHPPTFGLLAWFGIVRRHASVDSNARVSWPARKNYAGIENVVEDKY